MQMQNAIASFQNALVEYQSPQYIEKYTSQITELKDTINNNITEYQYSNYKNPH